MIGAVKGEIIYKKNNTVISFVNGVGYKIFVTKNLFNQLKLKDQPLFYIYSHIREDIFSLYGFIDSNELDLFEMLISVSGVGPKTAILVIDYGVEKIKQAILKADVGFFSAIPRLGRKNSQKIIIELKNKLGSLVDLDLENETNSETEELISALKQVGFRKEEILEAIKHLSKESISLEQKIREALKILGKKI